MKTLTRHTSGTTLVEMMVAVALLGIISIGLVGVFGSVSKAIQVSKTKSLAANLAQEQMQILKQKAFNKVLVTTSTAFLTPEFPSVPYDTGYYPPETITEGGIQFTRYTYVQVANENTGLLVFPGGVADTGMKAITTSVTWWEGDERRILQVRNVLGNIDTTQTTSVVSGNLNEYPAGTVSIEGALVTIAENVGWQDFSSVTGFYQINLSPGTYRLTAQKRGYFPAYKTITASPYTTTTQAFLLVPMASGTITGSVWYNNHLVISQVVGAVPDSLAYCQEYVEIFNPSTWTWTIGNGPGSAVIDLVYHKKGSAEQVISMNYVNLTVPPRSYYLFANTGTVVVGAVNRTANATYADTNTDFPDIIKTAGSGSCVSGGTADAVSIRWASTSETIDSIGWTQGSTDPDLYEGSPYVQGIGLQENEQYVRRSSTSGVTNGIGRAYDSGSNAIDFTSNALMTYPPRNASDVETVVAGVPAYGAYVSASDGLSQVVNSTPIGSPPWARFQLTSVATGTWNVIVASNDLVMEISTVTVTANTTTYMLNSLTVPAWNVANYHSVILSSEATEGYVSGWVRNVTGGPITTGINVGVGALTTPASTTDGRYFLRLSPGTYDITANVGNANSAYISQTSQTISVALGQIKSDLNFTLSQGGRIRGFVTRDGTNPLPGVSVVAMDINGTVRGQEVSGADGRYMIVNITTGAYTLEPVLGSGEVAIPTSASVTVSSGTTVTASTFTVIGAFGTVRGNVTIGGTPIRTGVLIVASTVTLASPPAITYGGISGAGYYMTNSYEDGSYWVDIRGSTSTTYKLYAYYTTFSGTVSSTTVRSQTGVTVTAGATTSGINFAW